MQTRSIYWLTILQLTLLSATGGESPAPAHDGSHDFDFLVGNWKAHVRRLPDRLVGSNTWIEYNGISNHKKLLDSNANFEEFEVDNPEKHLHIKGQTLRLYNPDSHQWSIYLLDLDKGVLSVPPVVGALERVLTTVLTLTLSNGEVSTRADEINEIRNGKVHYEVLENYEMLARLYGNDTAVVLGKTRVKGTAEGKPFDRVVQFTDTLIKRDGRWQLVAGHVSRTEK